MTDEDQKRGKKITVLWSSGKKMEFDTVHQMGAAFPVFATIVTAIEKGSMSFSTLVITHEDGSTLTVRLPHRL